MAGELEQAAAVLPERLRAAILAIPASVRETVLEVRLYAASPVRLTTTEGTRFLRPDGVTLPSPETGILSSDPAQIEETVLRACGYALHTVQKELANGFLPLPGGHRLGVCGKAVYDADGTIRTVTSFTALNLRVARFLPDAAKSLCDILFRDSLCSLILAGSPLCGKTTLLRSIAHRLSSGKCGAYYRVSVIDTRGEFSPLPFCDVQYGREKADGVECALRVFSPQMIICDEIANAEEVHALERGFAAGCACTVSVHVGSAQEWKTRVPLQALLRTEQFTQIVFPDRGASGYFRRICTPQELFL